jgi:DNA-binding CsgD family transcriptional regulator
VTATLDECHIPSASDGETLLRRPSEVIQHAVRGRLSGLPGMTEQRLTVLELAVQGITRKEIAEQLYIEPCTVNYHLGCLYDSLGSGKLIKVAAYYIRLLYQEVDAFQLCRAKEVSPLGSTGTSRSTGLSKRRATYRTNTSTKR